MGERDERYRQQRDRYRHALVDVAAAAVIAGVTAALDFLPPDARLRDDVARRVRHLADEVDRLTRHRG